MSLPINGSTNNYNEGTGDGTINGTSYIDINPSQNAKYGNAIRFPTTLLANKYNLFSEFELEGNSITFSMQTSAPIVDTSKIVVEIAFAPASVITTQADPGDQDVVFPGFNSNGDGNYYVNEIRYQTTVVPISGTNKYI